MLLEFEINKHYRANYVDSYPPHRLNCILPFKISLIACAIVATASATAQTNLGDITNEDLSTGEAPTIKINTPSVADSIRINNLKTLVSWQNFTVNVRNSFTVNGDTHVSIYSDAAGGGEDATHAFYLEGEAAVVQLNGNVEIVNTHADGLDSAYGANALYIQKRAVLTLGKEGADTLTRIISVASIPDAVSVKLGSTLTFNSTHNQVVGTIDLSSSNGGYEDYESTVTGTFSGSDSFWYGDEASSGNTTQENRLNNKGILNLTFENGAQWSYLNVMDSKGIPKRISAITLRNGGIINLFDEDIKNFLTEQGLYDRLNDGNYIVDHDYVRIGDLKGSGGIFRLGLNAEDKTMSDMVFIENSTTGGLHYFEPNDLQKLESITPENTLIFALVGKDVEHDVQFADIENLQGETLYDYELEIAQGTTDTDTFDRKELTNANGEFLTAEKDKYLNGQNWYIRRVTMRESTAAMAMTGSGYAAYDAAIEMDRRDRRLAEAVRNTEGDNGLWVRISHGRSGIDGQYRWDRTGVHVGFDREIVPGNTLGAWFSYTKGEADLLDINGRGTSDMTRYELAVYDTLTFNNQYLDFVGRIGRVSSEFDAASLAYRTTGDFDQDYAALSAEYGMTFRHASGFFVEPQVQMQATFLKSYDYDSDRTMSVEADSETSLQGRAGLRAGRQFSDDFAAGELYARADVLHQFTDGQDAVFRDNDGHVIKTNWGDRGTWGVVGLGGAVSWGKAYGLQLDVEHAFGGDVDNTWMITGRFNYAF